MPEHGQEYGISDQPTYEPEPEVPGEVKPAASLLIVCLASRLQTWLAQAGDALLALPAATVSRSVQNWEDWADINAATIRATWPAAHRSVIAALRAQAGGPWHAQLAGQADIASPVSLDAWIHAGQSILRTTRILMLTAFRRFWPVAVVLAVATGGLLYLAIANTSGTAKVWTSLVTVAAALGVTGG